MFKRVKKYIKNKAMSRRIGVETETQPQEHGPILHDVGNADATPGDVVLSFVELPRAARVASASPRAAARSSSSSARRAISISSVSPRVASASPRVTVRTKPRATSAPDATKNNKSPKHENKILPSSAPPALASQSSLYVQNRKMIESKKKLQGKRQGLQKEITEWDSKLNSLQYSQYYPQNRLYELKNFSELSNNLITKMLEVRFSTALKFKPFILDNKIIELLKGEFDSEKYKKFSNLFIGTDVNVDEIYLSVFLSNVTIIELEDCEIDEFTLKILSGINKLNVTYIILDYIMFQDETIFYSFLDFLKGHSNLNGLTLANIDNDIKGEKFKSYMNVIGELKSITWLEFTGIDTIYALESEKDLRFVDMFIDLLLKLNNLEMLILVANKITDKEYKQIFGDYLKIFKIADSSLKFALNDEEKIKIERRLVRQQKSVSGSRGSGSRAKVSSISNIENIYVKKCIFDSQNSNYELQISTDVGYEEKDHDRSIHFYTEKNESEYGINFVDVRNDKIIKKHIFENFNTYQEKQKKIDKYAIKKMYLQKKKDELYIMKLTIAQLSKQHLTLEHILEEQDKIARFEHQNAIYADNNNAPNKKTLLLEASKSSKQATLDMDNANKAIETITKMNNAAELLSKKIEELKKSAGSDSPKKGTSQGGKKTPKRK